jgi:voltage-gated sodium channel
MKSIFKNDNLLFVLIFFNVLLIYTHTFDVFSRWYLIFDSIDVLLTIFFVIEIGVKVADSDGRYLFNKLKTYLKDHWNKIDFFSILLALPSIGVLFISDLEMFAGFTALRSLRIFKFLRIIEYIPDGKRISKQMFKALKSIFFIIFSFFIYSTIICLISVSLFKPYAPYYFNNAFDSFFTIFKIFSGDGFTDVVGEIEQNASHSFIYFTKFYFVFIVFSGSILGLSLINSIFIDQMSQVEEQIESSEQDMLNAMKSEISILKKQNEEILKKLNDLTQE